MSSRTAYSGKRELVARIDDANALQGRAQRDLLAAICDADKAGIWINDGCKDMAEWVAGRYGVSRYRALRLVRTSHRLDSLPATAAALTSGRLSLDKTVELTRFATPEDEEALLRWAVKVRPVTIRERADEINRPEIEEVRDAERGRHLSWQRGLDHRLHLEAALPAYEGSLLIKSIDRIAAELPDSPEDPRDPDARRAAKRADALALLAEGELTEAGGDAALVVIEAPLGALTDGDGPGARTEDGAVLHPLVASRLLCDSRYEVQATDGSGGGIVGLGRSRRSPDATLRRALEKRDHHCCVFPGCEARAYLRAHHAKWWVRDQGPTDLDLLVLVCTTHHKLFHDFGWDVAVTADGIVWFRPDGSVYRAEPALPDESSPEPRRLTPEELERCWHEVLGIDSDDSLSPFGLELLAGDGPIFALLRTNSPRPHRARGDPVGANPS